jgi:hypothetical protein
MRFEGAVMCLRVPARQKIMAHGLQFSQWARLIVSPGK